MQFNKRDLSEHGIPLLPVKQLQRDLNRQLKVPYYTASAIRGEGVGATLKTSLKLTLKHLQKELRWAG